MLCHAGGKSLDARQFVPPSGQAWTSLEELKARGHRRDTARPRQCGGDCRQPSTYVRGAGLVVSGFRRSVRLRRAGRPGLGTAGGQQHPFVEWRLRGAAWRHPARRGRPLSRQRDRALGCRRPSSSGWWRVRMSSITSAFMTTSATAFERMLAPLFADPRTATSAGCAETSTT